MTAEPLILIFNRRLLMNRRAPIVSGIADFASRRYAETACTN
jgi:hypothetical protein